MADLYEVLGVDRDAAPVDIKRAYFRLIRKFPPETHPEKFYQLREAYEVLSNPPSRTDYDGRTGFGRDVQRLLDEGLLALSIHDYAKAQNVLLLALEKRPEMHLGRELLGQAYLLDGKAQEALLHFAILVEADPQNPLYLWRMGNAHAKRGHHGKALSTYGEALDFNPQDARVLSAMVESLVALGRYDDALSTLDHAVHMDGEVSASDMGFLLRKVELHYLRQHYDQAEQELAEMLLVLPKDAATREALGRKLYELSARMFSEQLFVAGENLRQFASRLEETKREHTPLVYQQAQLLTLPKELRKLLHQLLPKDAALLKQPLWGKALLSTTLGLLALGWGGLLSRSSQETWPLPLTLWVVLLLTLAPLLLAGGLHRLLRTLRGAFHGTSRYAALMPPYLLWVDLDRAELWPLPTLLGANQRTSRRETWIDLFFPDGKLTLQAKDLAQARHFVTELHRQKDHTLSALAEAGLEGAPGGKLLPVFVSKNTTTNKQDQPRPHPKAWFSGRRALAAFFWLGLGAFLATTAVNENHRRGAESERRRQVALAQREEASWALARSPQAIWDHRQQFPGFRDPKMVRARLQEVYGEAKARYLAKAGSAKGHQAILDILDALALQDRHEHPDVLLRFRWTVGTSLRSGPATAGRRINSPFSREQLHKRHTALTESLSVALARVIPTDLLRLSQTADREDSMSPAIVIHYVILPKGWSKTAEPSERPSALSMDFHLTVETQSRRESKAVDKEALDFHTEPPPSAMPLTEEDYDASYTRATELAFDWFSYKLTGYFVAGDPASSK